MTASSRDRLMLRAGIAAGQRWPINQNTMIMEIPPGKLRWYVPIAEASIIDSAYANAGVEEIQPSRFAGPDGSIWLGYGPRANVLVFWIARTLEEAAE